MPGRRQTNKSEPITFVCPSCEAQYIIVTIDASDSAQRNKFSCVKCGTWFPLTEGQVALEYILLKSKAE